NAWVSGGTPAGDTANAPAPPVYNNGSLLNGVDMVIQIPAFTVPANVNYDLYQCFTIPTNLSQDQFMTAVEAIPGNPSIVHHILIYEDTTSSQQSLLLDNNTPEPGYTSFGGPGVNNAALVGGWVPGQMPSIYPNGMGVTLHKNSRLVLQIHYPAGSAGKTDSTKLNIKLSTAALRPVFIQPPLNHGMSMTDGPLSIPANSSKTFHTEYTIPTSYPIQGVSLLNVAPHAHLLCKNWLVFGKTPAGDTIPFIRINDWDFHWQGFYTFQKLIFFPKGSTFYGVATYDNTANNPHNPSSPPQNVHAGESTTDEMMLVYFSYLIYQQGDEDMVLDSTILEPAPTAIDDPKSVEGFVSTAQLYDAMPNPANNETRITYYLPAATKVELKVYDLTGKLVDEIQATGNNGFNSTVYNTAKLQPGNYLYSLNVGGIVKTKQLSVVK
ncbi:MAG TPA: T9SS type A sorting domain-containing protein, partial [Chitinophagales bacterium]|nr:T9SS type A sorting domain-containing protein [Chitinophagales bacterium]